MFLWQNLHKIHLNLFRVLLFCESQAFGDPLYMGIHHNTGLMKYISPDDIGSLTPHARKQCQLLQGARHLPAVFFTDHLRTSYNILCLVVIESRGLNILLQLL